MATELFAQDRGTLLAVDRFGDVEGELDEVSDAHLCLLEVANDVAERELELFTGRLRDRAIRRHPDLTGQSQNPPRGAEFDLMRVGPERCVNRLGVALLSHSQERRPGGLAAALLSWLGGAVASSPSPRAS